MSLKENLVRYMKEKGLTVRELANKTDISEPTLKRLRSRDDTNPTLDVLVKISAALEVPVNNLIQNPNQTPVFYQGKVFTIPDNVTEFIIIFTKDTFSFSAGTKAVFKKYTVGQPITKYIMDKNQFIFEKVDAKKWLFQDENSNNYSVDQNSIFAYIVKELYEVNYV